MARQQRKEEQNQGRGQSGGKESQGAEPTRGGGGGGGQQRGSTSQRGGGSQVTESGRFQNMSIEELRKEAKNKNIKDPENQSKDDLVRKLQDAEERRG